MTDYRAQAERVGRFILSRLESRGEVMPGGPLLLRLSDAEPEALDYRLTALGQLREWARQWSGHPDYQEAVR